MSFCRRACTPRLAQGKKFTNAAADKKAVPSARVNNQRQYAKDCFASNPLPSPYWGSGASGPGGVRGWPRYPLLPRLYGSAQQQVVAVHHFRIMGIAQHSRHLVALAALNAVKVCGIIV